MTAHPRSGAGRRTVAAVGVALVGYGGFGLLAREPPVPTADELDARSDAASGLASGPRRHDVGIPDAAVAAPTGVPARLVIEAIDVDHPIVAMGLLDDGGMEVPDDVDEIGWYEPGVTPGEPGSAVLAGHVDSRAQGPGAFFDLRLLVPGDVVVIVDEGGVARSWVVDRLVRYPKDELPVGDLVRWGGPGTDLALVTCGGEFDRTAGSYVDNVVAYAVRR